MKILFVVHNFFPKFFAGTERYVLNASKQLLRMGNSVKVLTYGIADPPDTFAPKNNIFYREYVYEGIPVISIRHREIPLDEGYRISDDIMEDILPILLTEKPDIVHVAHPMRVSAVITASKMIGIPVALTITDFWLLCVRGRFFRPDYSFCESSDNGEQCKLHCFMDDSIFERNRRARQLFDSVDLRIAPSRFLIGIFKKNSWDKTIHHISHGMDYKYVAPSQSERKDKTTIIFAYMGVVGRFKGIDVLLESFKKVTAPNIRLQIYGNLIGDGTIEIVRRAEMEDYRIKSIGQFSHDELPYILNNVDIVVVPSTTLESYGLVVIESLAYGVPVITSDIVGSAHEFLRHRENGMLFSFRDPSQLTDIIRQISDQPSIIQMLKSNIAPPPRLEEEVFLIEKLYKSVLA